MAAIRKRFKFSGKKLFICDMRPGFTADGVAVRLPKGEYKIVLEPDPSGQVVGFSVLLADASPDSESEIDVFDVDMARVGLYDRDAFRDIFGDDDEALFEWSEEASDKVKSKWGGFIQRNRDCAQAVFVNVGCDCLCKVQLLREKSRDVGVRILPELPPQTVDQPENWQFNSIDVKCFGFADEWDFGAHRGEVLDFDDILEDVISAFEIIIEDAPFAIIDTNDVDPNAPISRYRKRFKGVESITVFYETDDTPRRRVSPPPSYRFPLPGKDASSSDLAKAVLAVLEAVNDWPNPALSI